MTAEHCKRWPCAVCGHSIRVDLGARLGHPRYVHVYPADNLHGIAVRGSGAGSSEREPGVSE